MSVVVDASITLAYCFADERTEAIEAIFDHIAETYAVVPELWHLEIANSFQMAIRRKRIDAAFRAMSLERLMIVPITVDTETTTYAWNTTLRLADRFGLTVYDAAYLELAQRRSLPLATLDRELEGAAYELKLPTLNLET